MKGCAHVIRLTQLILVGCITDQAICSFFYLLNKDFWRNIFGILGISKLVKVKNGPVEAVRENGSFQAVGFNR